jgi:hypothetical protein
VCLPGNLSSLSPLQLMGFCTVRTWSFEQRVLMKKVASGEPVIFGKGKCQTPPISGGDSAQPCESAWTQWLLET